MNWKREYFELLADHDLDPKGMKLLTELKLRNIPRYLYRYNEIGDFTFSNISRNTTRMRLAGDFNDPYDSCFTIAADLLEKRYIQPYLRKAIERANFQSLVPASVLEKIAKAPNQIEAFLDHMMGFAHGMSEAEKEALKISLHGTTRDHLENGVRELHDKLRNLLRICCFTEHPDSTLMWSHYARHHTGICFQYETPASTRSTIKPYYLHPVLYQDERMDMTKRLADTELDRRLTATIAACIKASCWSYESEWRFIYPNTDRIEFDFGKPSRIIAGSKISGEDLTKLEKLCDELEIPLAKAQLESNSFRIHVPPL